MRAQSNSRYRHRRGQFSQAPSSRDAAQERRPRAEDRRLNCEQINLGNWLTAPYNRVAFRRPSAVLPVAEIKNDRHNVGLLRSVLIDPAQLAFTQQCGQSWTIDEFCQATHTDGLLILLDGRIVFEWYTPRQSCADPHLTFSVTKALVGCLAGILIEQGKLDPEKSVADYLPHLAGSGFREARLRDLLDMTVSLEFEESHGHPTGAFARYRAAAGWQPVPPEAEAYGMHEFLSEMRARDTPHGARFEHSSPNTDVLGLICERVARTPLPTLISECIWKPLGAESPAYMTLDRFGVARAAGGFACTLRDMARLGEIMRNCGWGRGRQVIPREWVRDILDRGDRAAWRNGTLASWIPGGCYRSHWWITNNSTGAYFATGIFGQWIYVAPTRGVVIVKQASPPVGAWDRDRFALELQCLDRFAERAEHAGDQIAEFPDSQCEADALRQFARATPIPPYE